jgi:CRISPR/Cas system-associated protein Cas10 (large subunit of type III CRISPR-Cas system)
MLDFAGQMRQWFAEEFGSYDLTLSAGLALIKPKRPIKFAVAEAERLLEEAKTKGKDQLAALGDVWKWELHEDMLRSARQLAQWVNSRDMQRGWLHTLLELRDARHGSKPDPLATARLAYHVDRNYSRRSPARKWAETVIQHLDSKENSEIRYLPSVLRYGPVSNLVSASRNSYGL